MLIFNYDLIIEAKSFSFDTDSPSFLRFKEWTEDGKVVPVEEKSLQKIVFRLSVFLTVLYSILVWLSNKRLPKTSKIILKEY